MTASDATPPADERLRDLVSRGEMERRWALLRTIMEQAGVDAIVVQGCANNIGINGYARWLTGSAFVGSYPSTILFDRTAEITVISHGATGGDMQMDPAGEEFPGAIRRLTTPSFPMIHYTAQADGTVAGETLRARGVQRLALLGSFTMGYEFVQALLRTLGGDATIVSIVDAVDRAKAIKSEEEWGFIRRAGIMQDELMALCPAIIKPGMREYEVTAELTRAATLAGSQTGFILTSSGRPGLPGPPMFPRQSSLQGRTLREGDIMLVLAENSGAGGYVTHMNRLFVLGKTPPEIAELYAAMVEAQDYTLSLTVPGAACSDIFAQYNAWMRAHGLDEERRLHAHGQGYDIVERPLIRNDETMSIEAGMNIGIHPAVIHRGVMVITTDNYLIHDAGPEPLHRTPRKMVEL